MTSRFPRFMARKPATATERESATDPTVNN
jgi:hypothetical protein